LQKRILLIIIFSQISYFLFAQKTDSTHNATQFSGVITATNNGISVIPSFTLGKPATIFDFSVHRNRFSFDPQFRFAIEDAKPWSFLFWFRYKLIQTPKFKMGIGTHPSYVFQTTTIENNGVSKEVITTKRYWAGELSPIYSITPKIGLGLYYLYAKGIDPDASKNTHFVALNGSFSNIKLTNQYYLKFNPQLFYLKIDNSDGYYFTETLTLAKKNSPFALSSIVTKTIDSNIASKDLVWNISLAYSY
jgi:hypothetical protein